MSNNSKKTKVSAIVLSVIFSFFGWLYTYDKDKKKFWTGFAVVVGVLVIYFAIMTLVIGAFFLPIVYLAYFGIWLWALIDSILKPNSFYENYPNG